MQYRFDIHLLLLRFGTFIVSLLVTLAGFVGAKYALFRSALEQFRQAYAQHVFVMCYALGPPAPPEWSRLDAVPLPIEALAIVLFAGLVSAFVPRRWLVSRRDRQRLAQRLLEEERFPDHVARQLKD